VSESKKMTNADDVGDRISAQALETQERRLAVLLNNSLVAGNQSIAERILQNSKPVPFKKGEKLIVQGASDDCTYFILSGQVEVKINGRHIDTRAAPQVVGEMAAKRAGAVRTADVIATSTSVEALSVSGSDFRAIMRDYESFRKNLDNDIDELSRRKISQLGASEASRGLSWTVISGATGVISGLVAALAAFLASYSNIEVLLSGVLVGLLAFITVLLVNPELRYRNLASASGWALIGLIVYGSISFALTVKGDDTDLPLIDFSVQTEQKLGMFLVGAIALLLLTWIGGILDLKLGRSKD